ncbi:PAS domain S-box protein [Candidatus Dojkabacteria bacterium]|nr:PAS domain S-box protein [Candidatus Dojkabacteria bacterium]
MNQLLDQIIKQYYQNIDSIPQEQKPFIEAIDQSMNNILYELEECKKNLNAAPQELAAKNLELVQDSKHQQNIIENLRRAIVTLEPNTDILKKASKTNIDEADYLIESLLNLINAHKQAADQLQERKQELEELNRLLKLEKDTLAEQQAKDQAVLFAIGDGLIVTDKEGTIVMVNKSFENLLGWKKFEVVGKPMSSIVVKTNQNGRIIPEDERLHNKVIQTGKTFTSPPDKTFYYIRKDKSKFPVSITVAPIILQDNITGVVEVFKDITKEKEIEKAKNEFVSLASHQMRTPLSSINWYTEMLMDDDLSKNIDEHKSYLAEIDKAVGRMQDMINALLNISRLELGTFSIEPEIVNLIDLAQKAVKELTPKIIAKNLQISGRFNPEVPKIKTDPKLVAMCFQNLLSNAVKYTPEQGEITLTIDLTKNNEDVLISVNDTGYGIPEKDKERIFTKLFRASNIKKHDTDGNGLGLYIVKQILEKIGGEIWFESEEGKGTTFYFTLPTKEIQKKEGTKQLT